MISSATASGCSSGRNVRPPGTVARLACGNASLSCRPSSGPKYASSSPHRIRTGPVNWPNRLAASSRTPGRTPRANLARSRRIALLASGSYPLAGQLGIERSAGQRAEAERAGPHPRRPQPGHQAGDDPGMAPGEEQRRERAGRERAERVAVGQHRGADPAGVARQQELADRPAGVVADDGHVVEAQRGDEVADEPGDPRAARGRRRRSSGAGGRRAGASARSCGCPRPRAGRRPVPTAASRRAARAGTPPAGGNWRRAGGAVAKPALRQVGHGETG